MGARKKCARLSFSLAVAARRSLRANNTSLAVTEGVGCIAILYTGTWCTTNCHGFTYHYLQLRCDMSYQYLVWYVC